MTLHVAILGIDGSGKSTLAAALPVLLAAETGATVAGVGEEMRVVGPLEDSLGPQFNPDGLPPSVHVTQFFRRLAKKYSSNRSIYPIFKLPQMLFQDRAARRLSAQTHPDVAISDGTVLLTACGRAANYRRPASAHDEAARPAPGPAELCALLAHVLDGAYVPPAARAALPPLDSARRLSWISQQLDLDAVWLPDVAIFLDLAPEAALARVQARGQKVDRHENLDDLRQARAMYLKTLDAFKLYRGRDDVVQIVCVDGLSPGAVCGRIVEALRPRVAARLAARADAGQPLGTTTEKLSGASFFAKVLNFNYLVKYMLGHFFRGAWREPFFAATPLGRLFLKEGYSAGIMAAIYDRDDKPQGFCDQVFLEYPLHRAVYDRLGILSRRIAAELDARLSRGTETVTIFTAPSGYAYDLFRPLEALATHAPRLLKRIRIVACDLDPHDVLQRALSARAQRLGVAFQFLRGDILTPEVQAQIRAAGPYDLALFVGLSSWLPKPGTLQHLTALRRTMKPGGVLVSDCFTAASYALSGRYVGYRAHYYTPAIYKVLLDACGFDGPQATVDSGRDKINHVLVAPLAPERA